jgi:hypothetical protein
MREALVLYVCASEHAVTGDMLAAEAIINLARKLESGLDWPDILDDTEVRENDVRHSTMETRPH